MTRNESIERLLDLPLGWRKKEPKGYRLIRHTTHERLSQGKVLHRSHEPDVPYKRRTYKTKKEAERDMPSDKGYNQWYEGDYVRGFKKRSVTYITVEPIYE